MTGEGMCIESRNEWPVWKKKLSDLIRLENEWSPNYKIIFERRL